MKEIIIVLYKGGITITTHKLNCYKHLRNSSTNEKNKKKWSVMQIIGHGLTELHCELRRKWIYFMSMVCVPHVCLWRSRKWCQIPGTHVEVEEESKLHRAVL